MRARPFAVLAAAVLAVGLAACGSSSEPSAEGTEPAAGAEDGFPATVSTKFGDVTIDAKPTKVVALGWGDAETALALGVEPVGASDWVNFGGEGVGPWAEGLYTNPPELIGTLEPSYESIAALEPDLILDVKGAGDQARYDRLSSIATTVGIPEGSDNYLTSQEDQVTMIATALGEQERGEELLKEVSDAFAAAAEAHPDWKGKTVSAVTKTADGWGAYLENDVRVTFLENLGFELNPKVAELPPDAGGFATSLSAENLDVVDADLVVAFPIFIETNQLTEDAAWKAVPAVQSGHTVVIDGELSQAYSLATPAATLYAIDQLVPKLEAATAS